MKRETEDKLLKYFAAGMALVGIPVFLFFVNYSEGKSAVNNDLKRGSAELLMKDERRIFRTYDAEREVLEVYVEEPQGSGKYLSIDRYLKSYEEAESVRLKKIRGEQNERRN